MEQKENKKVEAGDKTAASPKGNNKVLFWILGGCLVLLVAVGLVIGVVAYLGYRKVKNEIKQNQSKIEQWQNTTNKISAQSESASGGKEEPQSVSQPTPAPAPTQPSPEAIGEEPTPSGFESAAGSGPYSGERQIGYVKKVYTKDGKNYLSIDYIQWLTGAEAEKAMREDGQCPKTGECIVFDDYYIRNVNPLIRTFEVSPDAKITMQTYDMEETGLIHPQEISFAQFSWIFAPKVNSRLKDVPYIVEISSKKITKINEQYIP